jgi:hypothetical protein
MLIGSLVHLAIIGLMAAGIAYITPNGPDFLKFLVIVVGLYVVRVEEKIDEITKATGAAQEEGGQR